MSDFGAKEATTHTQRINAAVLTSLPFSDTDDYGDAMRGFITAPVTLTITTLVTLTDEVSGNEYTWVAQRR